MSGGVFDIDESMLNDIRRVSEAMHAADGAGAFSTAERIAGAFVNDRSDWLPDGYTGIGEALARLGAEWREGVVEVWTRKYNGRW